MGRGGEALFIVWFVLNKTFDYTFTDFGVCVTVFVGIVMHDCIDGVVWLVGCLSCILSMDNKCANG